MCGLCIQIDIHKNNQKQNIVLYLNVLILHAIIAHCLVQAHCLVHLERETFLKSSGRILSLGALSAAGWGPPSILPPKDSSLCMIIITFFIAGRKITCNTSENKSWKLVMQRK